MTLIYEYPCGRTIGDCDSANQRVALVMWLCWRSLLMLIPKRIFKVIRTDAAFFRDEPDASKQPKSITKDAVEYKAIKRQKQPTDVAKVKRRPPLDVHFVSAVAEDDADPVRSFESGMCATNNFSSHRLQPSDLAAAAALARQK